MKYSSEAVAFETWDWGDFGKTVGVSAAMGAVSGSLAYGIGEVGSALASGGMGEVGVGIITTGLHMSTQGGLSAAMGGDFWSAALAAGVGHLGGMAMSKAGLGKFGQAAGASVLSGTTSVISGGSFFEGAVVGLIVHMCNRGMHGEEKQQANRSTKFTRQRVNMSDGTVIQGLVDWFEYINKNDGKDPVTGEPFHVINIIEGSTLPKPHWFTRIFGSMIGNHASGIQYIDGKAVKWSLVDRDYLNNYRANYISEIRPLDIGDGSYQIRAIHNGYGKISLTIYSNALYIKYYNQIFKSKNQ